MVETDEVNQTVVFHARRRRYSVEALLRKAIDLSRERQTPVLLIGIQDLPAPPDGARSTRLFTSKPGAIGDEVFTVYKLETR